MIDALNSINKDCHNPYFNRWFSAMILIVRITKLKRVTILILIDGFLQSEKEEKEGIAWKQSQSLF